MIRVGTRSSRLALVQANIVKSKLVELAGVAPDEIEIVPISTTGDKIKDKNLYQIGGKGLFIKEIEEALLSNQIDIAVHSLKDLPANIPEKLKIACVLDKRSPFDVFLSSKAKGVLELPENAILGTSSPRRACQVLNVRPDIKIIPFRGNVDTRLNKLRNNIADATILSEAGLDRLKFDDIEFNTISTDIMVPAVGQGAICVECREEDNFVIDILNKINDSSAYKLALCERVFLEGLNADCKSPVGGYASYQGNQIIFQGIVGEIDGTDVIRVRYADSVDKYEEIGVAALEKVKQIIESRK